MITTTLNPVTLNNVTDIENAPYAIEGSTRQQQAGRGVPHSPGAICMTDRDNWQKPVVFYDGGCPFFRREVMHYRRMVSDRQLCWIDIHAHPESLQAFGLTLTEAMQRMHVMESDGRMVSGGAAFVAMWRCLPRYRPLAWAASLPGIFWLAEQAFSRFARWRWKGRCDQVCGRT